MFDLHLILKSERQNIKKTKSLETSKETKSGANHYCKVQKRKSVINNMNTKTSNESLVNLKVICWS